MKWLSAVLTAGAFAALYYLENRRPLRRQIYDRRRETARNLALAAGAGLATSLLEKPLTDRLTKYVDEKKIGLVKIAALPKFVETAAAIVLLDYTLYLWHVLTHKVPFLWRFHRVHHADLDLTVSTAIRFHFGEISISVLFRAGQILLIGVAPQALAVWQTLLFLSIFFHHSNVRLPKKFEEALEKIITTPRLHGIHHSVIESEMNSNWSSGLSVWDKIHGTFQNQVRQREIVIGAANFPSEGDVTLPKMLAAPFV